jgi:predicted amidohydrolase
MGEYPVIDRRSFVSKMAFMTATSATASVTTNQMIANGTEKQITKLASSRRKTQRLPREVCVVTISQDSFRESSPSKMVASMIRVMEQSANLEPDVICLPELFPFSNISGDARPIPEVAEEGIGPLLEPLARFAKANKCYIVCPIYTKQENRYYNSAVFLDRNGDILGAYHKARPTESEMQIGVSPGPIVPPIFETDFGKVGAQICFDIEWEFSWRELRKLGAEIVFWPSAFSGGAMVNAKAWQNRYAVVTSTNKDISKICDVSGTELAATSRWHPWVSATINLEKAFLHTWPYVQKFPDIQRKYGDRIRITTFALEEWSIIESRDPELKIASILKEFELLTIDQHLQRAEREQDARRATSISK